MRDNNQKDKISHEVGMIYYSICSISMQRFYAFTELSKHYVSLKILDKMDKSETK